MIYTICEVTIFARKNIVAKRKTKKYSIKCVIIAAINHKRECCIPDTGAG